LSSIRRNLTFAPFTRVRRSRSLELPSFYEETSKNGDAELGSRGSIDRENQLRRLARRLSAASFAIPRAASPRSPVTKYSRKTSNQPVLFDVPWMDLKPAQRQRPARLLLAIDMYVNGMESIPRATTRP
jgi:hypothetical protein